MKKYSIIFAALFVMLITGIAAAQNEYNPNYPKDFTKDQADSTITYRNNEISGLKQEIQTTNDAVTKANADLQQRMADNDKCKNDLYAMCGSDRNGFNAYRERLAKDESELNALRSQSPDMLNQSKARVDALETEIRYLRGNKLVLIPDHRTRVMAMSNSFIGEPSPRRYLTTMAATIAPITWNNQ